MRYFLCLLVLAFISLPCFALASSFDVDIFIKESSLLLGKSYKEIGQKISLQKNEKRGNQDAQIYKASNTGIKAESGCKSIDFYFKENKLTTILCNTTEYIADNAIERAYKNYQGKGGGVGTGTYVWCVYNRGLEISVPIPLPAYIAVHETCPLNLEEYNEDLKRKLAE